MMMVRLFCLALCLLASAPPAWTAELPPRPRIEDYTDHTAFVADVLAWQQARDELERNPPKPAPEAAKPPLDWHHVTGPEDLDTAIMNAEGYIQPTYKEKFRFNRTTHISFPLQRLQSNAMSAEGVAAGNGKNMADTLDRELFLLPVEMMEKVEQIQSLTAHAPEPNLSISVNTLP